MHRFWKWLMGPSAAERRKADVARRRREDAALLRAINAYLRNPNG